MNTAAPVATAAGAPTRSIAAPYPSNEIDMSARIQIFNPDTLPYRVGSAWNIICVLFATLNTCAAAPAKNNIASDNR
jgi:hypothetical protein